MLKQCLESDNNKNHCHPSRQLPTGNTFSKNSFQYETPLMPGSSNELYSKSFERRGAAQSGLLGSSLNVSPKYVVYVSFVC